MGGFLCKPNTEKSNVVGAGKDFKYVIASMQGWRQDMEDVHHVEIPIENEPPLDGWSFFAVFDGHTGIGAARRAAKYLLQMILETAPFQKVFEKLIADGNGMTDEIKELVKEGVRTGFLNMDAFLAKLMNDPWGLAKNERSDLEISGSTAICAILTPECVIFANLGDSRGFISRRSNQIFSTEDHKPCLEKERDRIVKAGGSVILERVNGTLALSRAFGDFRYKSVSKLSPTEQMVSPEPDVYIIDRNKEDDEFLVLACDGIYDVLDNEQLCMLVRSRLSATDDFKLASNQILDVCLSKGSRDNMTLIMVIFECAPKLNEKVREGEQRWLEKVEVRAHEILATKEDLSVDTLTSLLQDMGDLKTPLPGGIHLARSLIDKIMAEYKRDEPDPPPSLSDADMLTADEGCEKTEETPVLGDLRQGRTRRVSL